MFTHVPRMQQKRRTKRLQLIYLFYLWNDRDRILASNLVGCEFPPLHTCHCEASINELRKPQRYGVDGLSEVLAQACCDPSSVWVDHAEDRPVGSFGRPSLHLSL